LPTITPSGFVMGTIKKSKASLIFELIFKLYIIASIEKLEQVYAGCVRPRIIIALF